MNLKGEVVMSLLQIGRGATEKKELKLLKNFKKDNQ